ncbi:MAG: DUF481 domain-containing protein [Vicinamibacterales bacterium]|nr:DUF481 domain-containing protein [Vicinamibacterales bacterium]
MHSFLVLLVLLVSMLVPTPARAQSPEADALRALETRLATALTTKDAAGFEALLAPDFVLRGLPDVPRERWLANALTLCWGDTFELTDFRLLDNGEASAVVSFVLTTFRDPETCDRAIIRSLVTDVWRHDGEGWRLALRHAGPAGGGLAQQFARENAPPPLWERSGELSLVSTGGNTETQTLGVGGAVTWRPGAWRTDAKASFVRSETDQVRTAEALTADVRQSRRLTPHLEVFGRGAYLANEFAGIDRRVTTDAGLGWNVSTSGAHRLRLDAALGYSRETRLASPTLSSALANLGGAYRWQITRATAVTDDALVTASLDEREDWRLSNTLAVTTTMTRVLSIRVAHELRMVNQPVPGFERRDTVIAVALVAKF